MSGRGKGGKGLGKGGALRHVQLARYELEIVEDVVNRTGCSTEHVKKCLEHMRTLCKDFGAYFRLISILLTELKQNPDWLKRKESKGMHYLMAIVDEKPVYEKIAVNFKLVDTDIER